MSTKNNSPKKKAATTKKAAPKKAATSGNSAKSATPKKKPGRPKKQATSPNVKFKADARDGDGDGLVQDGTQFERRVDSPAKNVQQTGAVVPGNSTTVNAPSAVPKVSVNTSWSKPAPKRSLWSRIFRRNK